MVIQGDPDIESVEHLKTKNQNELIVLGAYRRGIVSRWFKASIADELINARAVYND